MGGGASIRQRIREGLPKEAACELSTQEGN